MYHCPSAGSLKYTGKDSGESLTSGVGRCCVADGYRSNDIEMQSGFEQAGF